MLMKYYITNSCRVYIIQQSVLEYFLICAKVWIQMCLVTWRYLWFFISSVDFQRSRSTLPEVRRLSACAERDNILLVHFASVQHLAQFIPHQLDSKSQFSATAYGALLTVLQNLQSEKSKFYSSSFFIYSISLRMEDARFGKEFILYSLLNPTLFSLA